MKGCERCAKSKKSAINLSRSLEIGVLWVVSLIYAFTLGIVFFLAMAMSALIMTSMGASLGAFLMLIGVMFILYLVVTLSIIQSMLAPKRNKK